jgi:hypothetical protein
MDRKLRKILTECIRDIETGARDVEGCLQRYADRAAELRPHLELWSGLKAAAKAEPNIGSQGRGQHQLLTRLSEVKRGGRKHMIPFLTPALVKAGAVAVAAVLVIGGTAGASAALGGPDLAGEVLSGIGISNPSDTGKEHANPNAFDGADNAGQGINNASETGRQHANQNAAEGTDNAPEANREQEMNSQQEMERACEGCDNVGEGTDNAPEANREQEMNSQQEMERACEGCDNVGEGTDNAPEANREQEMNSQQEMERACEGCDNVGEGTDNAPEANREQEMNSQQEMERACEGCDNGGDPSGNASGLNY